ncbi:GAF domain-containing protein [Kineococcus sp. SYSU DK005]|uniref:GAF domain-containing protein n=1 Tax=Kineococcus sp. SYSU DK005 TaxID=3383126 RepID=UPI003D7D4A69
MSAPPTRTTRPAAPVAAAPGFAAVQEAARALVGVTLFTVLAWDAERCALSRVHTSHPREYPVGGEKFMPPDAPWPQHVLVRQRTHLGPRPADVAAVFADWPAIAALGCGATLNVPVVAAGRTLGALNLLAPEGTYDESSVAAVAPLAELAREPLLAWHENRKGRNP